jgi:hypothetical protein
MASIEFEASPTTKKSLSARGSAKMAERSTAPVSTLGPGRHEVDLARGVRPAPGVYIVRLTQGASALARNVRILE